MWPKEKKKTVVLGASPNPARYSFKAVKSLLRCGHEAIAVGFRPGVIYDTFIQRGKPEIEDVHTIAMYIGEQRQDEFRDYIFSLKPKRVIFNPGTINTGFMKDLEDQDVEVVEGCTLVMLDSGEF
ncbi:MAG TPA: CoA-binding protein [Bacteroidales bacterium]|nr:CoA-binding protein [Bacteroidales bacterium]